MSALHVLEDLEPLFKIFFSFVCKEVPGTMGKNYWPIYGKSKAGRWRNLSTSTSDRVLCKIYRLGEKFRVSERQEFPLGGGDIPPRNVLKRICAEMQSGAFWDTTDFEKCYSGILFYFLVLITFWQCYNAPCSFSSILREGILTSCALTSSRLDKFTEPLIW